MRRQILIWSLVIALVVLLLVGIWRLPTGRDLLLAIGAWFIISLLVLLSVAVWTGRMNNPHKRWPDAEKAPYKEAPLAERLEGIELEPAIESQAS